MKLLFINTIDNRGGAAQLTWRLRQQLQDNGHEVPYFVGSKFSKDSSVHVIKRYPGQVSLEKIFGNDLVFARSDSLLSSDDFQQADLVHAHNLHSYFFNLKTLVKMSQKMPVIWTLHDLWPITGGNATQWEMDQQLVRWKFANLLPTDKWLLHQKQALYKNLNATIVVGSNWMAKKVQQSVLNHLALQIIPHGIDTNIFKPGDKAEIRKKLNIPQEQMVALFVAKGGLNNRYKGGTYIQKLVVEFPQLNFLVVGQEQAFNNQMPNNLQLINYAVDPMQMANYFRSADFFIYPTLADSFGLVAAEAQACGLPVITFNTDALSEIVKHKQTGFIVPQKKYEQLAASVSQLIKMSREKINQMSHEAEMNINDNYSLGKMVQSYEKLYRSVTEHV